MVGEQKIKQNKNGGTREYIYYHYSRQVDRNCKELFARESDIIEQLYEMRHKLMPDKEVLEPGFRKAIEKTGSIAGTTFEAAFDTYVKYALYKGTKYEQTQLVRNVDTKLALHNRKILIISSQV